MRNKISAIICFICTETFQKEGAYKQAFTVISKQANTVKISILKTVSKISQK